MTAEIRFSNNRYTWGGQGVTPAIKPAVDLALTSQQKALAAIKAHASLTGETDTVLRVYVGEEPLYPAHGDFHWEGGARRWYAAPYGDTERTNLFTDQHPLSDMPNHYVLNGAMDVYGTAEDSNSAEIRYVVQESGEFHAGFKFTAPSPGTYTIAFEFRSTEHSALRAFRLRSIGLGTELDRDYVLETAETWQQVKQTVTMPAGEVIFYLYPTETSSVDLGDAVMVKKIIIEAGEDAGEHFDGADLACRWLGTPGRSQSRYTPQWYESQDLRDITAILTGEDYDDGYVDIYVGPSYPVMPGVGDLWYDNQDLKRYDGLSWAKISDDGPPAIEEELIIIRDEVEIIAPQLPIIRDEIEEARQDIINTGIELDQRLNDAQDLIDEAQAGLDLVRDELLVLGPRTDAIQAVVDQNVQDIQAAHDLASAASQAATNANNAAVKAYEDALAALQNAMQGTGRVWSQATPPPAGTFYRWVGAGRSVSEKVEDGEVAAVNRTLPIGSGWAAVRCEITERNGYVTLTNNDPDLRSSQTRAGLPSTHYIPIEEGESFWQTMEVRIPEGSGFTVGFRGQAFAGNSYNGMTVGPNGYDQAPDDGQWHRISAKSDPVPEGTTRFSVGLAVASEMPSEGLSWDVRNISDLPPDIPYFDGDTPDDRANDLWINTAEDNKPYVWDSATKDWVPAPDGAITEAMQKALEALQLAEDAADAAADAVTKADNAITDTVIEYALHTSETTAPTSGWSTTAPTRTPGSYIWMRTIITYGSGNTNTTSPVLLTGNTGAPGSQGLPGPPGENGQPTYTWLKYASSATPTAADMSDSPVGKTHMGLAVNKLTPTESTSPNDYTWSLIKGEDGDDGLPGPPGADGQPTYTWIKYAPNGSPTAAQMTQQPQANTTHIGIAYNKPTATESNVPGDYRWSLIQGPPGEPGAPGAPAKTVTLTSPAQVLISPATGGATNPATTKVTGTAENTTISVWQYSRNGGTFSNTLPPGVTRSGNEVTITGSTMTDRTIGVRMADSSGTQDIYTVAKVTDGAKGSPGDPGAPGAPGEPGEPGAPGAPGQDAYTVLLTNESHAFPGGTSAAIAGNTTTSVLAYKGTTRQNVTVGTITGQVTGLTTSIASNGTNAPVITIAVTTSLTTRNGVLTIPVTVDGQSFTKQFSWSLALQGSPGAPGTPGAPGAPGDPGVSITSVTPYFRRQLSSAAAPAKPTTMTPPSGWVTTEPEYLADNSLYRTERIVYSNNQFQYTDVTKVSSWEIAAQALNSANGRNSVITSTSAASGTTNPNTGNPLVNGDVWWQWDNATNRNVIGQWVWNGTWQRSYINHQTIASVDVNKLVVSGSAYMDQAVVNKIIGDAAHFNLLTAETLAIMPGNIFPDPNFSAAGKWVGSGTTQVEDADMPGGTALQVVSATAQRGAYYGNSINYVVNLTPGATYRVRATVKITGSANQPLNFYIRGTLSSGVTSTSNTTLVPMDAVAGTTQYEADLTVPGVYDESKQFTFGIFTVSPYAAGKTFTISGVSVTRKVNGVLIEDGAVRANHVVAEEVAAALGQFINARIENLIVTEGATMNEAVINKLWTDVVRSRKITTDMLRVGQGNNLIVDPMFEDESLRNVRGAQSNVVGGWGFNTTYNLRWYGGTSQATGVTGNFYFYSENPAGGVGTYHPSVMIPVHQGQVLKMRAFISSSGSGGARWAYRVLMANGTTAFTSSDTVDGLTGARTLEHTYVVPNDVVAIVPTIQFHSNTTSNYVYGGASVINALEPSLFVDGSIQATLNIGTTGRVVVGNENATRTEVAPTGIEYWDRESGTDTGDAKRISTFGKNLEIIGGDGGQYGLQSDGTFTSRQVTSHEDMIISGSPLLGTLALRSDQVDLDTDLGWLDNLNFGGNFAENTLNLSPSTTWNTSGWKSVAEIQREQQAGRAVLVIVHGRLRFMAAHDYNRVEIRLRKSQVDLPSTLTPGNPFASSVIFDPIYFGSNVNTTSFTNIMGLHVPSRSEMARWGVQINNVSSQPNLGYRVEKIGLLFLDIGTLFDVPIPDMVDVRVPDDTTPPPTPPNPKKRYISRWYANSIRRRQGTIVTSSGDRTNQVLQGWTSGMSGNPFDTVLGFNTATAHYGEVGKSISTALGSGASVEQVRVRVTQLAGYSNVAVLLGTQSTQTGTTSPNWTGPVMSPGQSRYMIVNSTIRNNIASGHRYLSFGPGSKTNGSYASYYGLNGTSKQRIELEITYTR